MWPQLLVLWQAPFGKAGVDDTPGTRLPLLMPSTVHTSTSPRGHGDPKSSWQSFIEVVHSVVQ
jgi:hypothetical protein